MGKTTHGMYNHPLYKIWQSMKQRCCNPRHTSFHRYGGRGIGVCQRWINSFANFVYDMGDAPHGCSLERVDNDLGYSPGNCIWATRQQQAKNRSAPGTHMAETDRLMFLQKRRNHLALVRESQKIAPKQCDYCGNFFIHHGGHQDQKFCNRTCYGKSKTRHVEAKHCETCGKSFVPARKDTQLRVYRYCSIKCAKATKV